MTVLQPPVEALLHPEDLQQHPDPQHPGDPQRLPLGIWLTTLGVVGVPFLGLVAGIVLLWGWGFGWVDLGLLLGMYVVTGLGITIGFHRLFSHRAFETNRLVQFVLVAMGSMAVQAPLPRWVAFHRLHHRHSDQPEDPHSPYFHGPGLVGWLRGVWHAHLGWCFQPDPPNLSRFVRDLHANRTVRVANALYLVWVALGLLIPAALGGVLTGSWMGAVLGLIWGGLARIFLVHHITWSVNSLCHLWGGRPYPSNGDGSRNNFLCGILAFGEGWHNNHHAFPSSARHGLRWWQLDVSYWIIRALALVGLARNVKVPSAKALAQHA
jgi:stearoyl-CoA desaturase (delta-9 desaturase)